MRARFSAAVESFRQSQILGKPSGTQSIKPCWATIKVIILATLRVSCTEPERNGIIASSVPASRRGRVRGAWGLRAVSVM